MAFYDNWARRLGWVSTEQTAKPPPKDPTIPDPYNNQALSVGYGTQADPMAQSDRANAMAVIQASLRTAQERSRQTRYTDFETMDVGDIAKMLDAVVDAVLTFDDVTTGRGFKMECDDTGAEQVLTLAITAADLNQLAEEALRDMLKYGDTFGEPIFVGPQLVNVQSYTPSEMYVSKDDKGRLAKGKDDNGFFAAFQQKKQGQIVAGWQPWEMVHGKLFPSRKLTYSFKGLLDDIRPDWRKLQLVELGMVVARVTRAYPRRVHMVDMTGKDRGEQERTLLGYINRMTGRVLGRRPTNDDGLPQVDVGEDLYVATGYTQGPDGKPVPKLNEVRTEDPAIAGLAELGDVSYLRQKVWSAVPADVVGIKRNTTGDLDSQDIAYARLLRRCQTQLEKYLRGILDQVLLANGRLPSQVPYRIIFPVITVGAAWKHADARFRDSMTIRNYLEMGTISRRFAIKRSFNLSDREVDAIWQEIGEEAADPIFMPVDPNAGVGGGADPNAAAAGVKPARNGPPSVQGAVNKANNDKTPVPTAPSVVKAGTGAVTKNGINRGTNMGKRLRGNMSGG